MLCVDGVKLNYIVSLHQTTTENCYLIIHCVLYYIVSLHQTTTVYVLDTCNGTLYYIVSLHQTTTTVSTYRLRHGCIISFLYIKPQPSFPVVYWDLCCIISFLYIKPQLVTDSNENVLSCIISFLYIKPQPLYVLITSCVCCIISFLYIKPQRASVPRGSLDVVLYRFSTSNHNLILSPQFKIMLYYIVSLHQTTTHRRRLSLRDCCIISFLYIKPQRQFPPAACATVVLYRFSTSNHNLLSLLSTGIYVVLYRFSTSNHN